jgi:amidophosphoribosyltransferase
MPTKGELLSSSRTIEQITEFIGADSVVYMTLEELEKIAGKPAGFCTSCFTGRYPSGSLMPADVAAIELQEQAT